MATAHSQSRRRIGRVDLPDPLYPIWRWLTSVRIAILLIAVTALVTLIGVVIPQVPVQAQGNAAAVAQHINDQRGTWGFATDILADFPWFYNTNGGIFNLYNQPYWFLLIAVLAFSITTCTVSRFPPIWRTVRRPQRRVNDAYYERARHRFAFTTPADPDAIVRTFRKHHYKVQVEQRDGATYLFADRFQWAQLATFVMHLALILLLFGTLITKFGGEEFQFWLGEGQSRPLFATGSDRLQIQIIVDDAIAVFDDRGQALDFRSLVRVSTAGEVVAAGEVTVNGPLNAAGFRVHQAAYWENGAALQVRDVTTNQLLYSETLMLDEQFFGPRVGITNALTGEAFADEVVQLAHDVRGLDGAAYQLIPLDADTSIALILAPNDITNAVDFHYSVVPFAAASDLGANLTAADLRIDQPQSLGPHVRLYDRTSGKPLIDDVIGLSTRQSGELQGANIGLLPLTTDSTVAVGFDETAAGDRRFFYFNFDDETQRGLLQPGQRVALGAVELEYVGEGLDGSTHGRLEADHSQRIGQVLLTYRGSESVFFSLVESVPGATDEALVLLERFGQARTAEQFNARGGESVALARYTGTSSGGQNDRPSRLGLGLGGGQPRIDLDEGQTLTVGNFEYAYLGPREFTGLTVRRDPGATLFWIALVLGIAAMSVTFFVPRRRIWAKVTPQQTFLAGLAGHGVHLRGEFRKFARDVGAPDLPPVDEDDDE